MKKCLTRQEIFDTVARHLLTQMKVSELHNDATDFPYCAYRGDNDTKCAVGCLIPNDRYDSSIEGKTVLTLIYERPNIFDGVLDTEDEETLSLLFDLQFVHDNYDPREWREELTKNARRYDLSNAVVTSFP